MWGKLSHNSMMAQFEAQRVITLRLFKLSQGGPDAQKDAERMISEKVAASVEAGMTLAMGGSPGKVLRRYRTVMNANSKRLTKQSRRKGS